MAAILTDIRYVLVRSVLVATVAAAGSFLFARKLLFTLASHLNVTLYYYSLSEIFFSTVEIALYCGVFISVPFILLLVWHRFRLAILKRVTSIYLFAAFSILLFYLGAAFCYVIALPSGMGFLLSYQGGAIKAMISTERFVGFCITMIFAFGAAFELPIILALLGKIGMVTSRTLSRTRRYAVLVIVIAAAVITPTPDIYNMSLLAVPLYVLYEIGILLLRLGERNLTAKAKSV
jgi:sec-independent protein translocase protein TatC